MVARRGCGPLVIRRVLTSGSPVNHPQGLRTSEDDAIDEKVLRGGFRSPRADSSKPGANTNDSGEGSWDKPERGGQTPLQEQCILFVGDLARAISDSDLDKAFSTVGKVRGCLWAMGKSFCRGLVGSCHE